MTESSSQSRPTGARARARWLWQTLLAPRGWRTDLPLAVLTAALGFGLVVSVQAQRSPTGLAVARQDDLVRILADLGTRGDRLAQEIASLQSTEQQLNSSAGSGVALEQAKARTADLGILAGTIAAHGPGITVQIADPSAAVTASVLVDAIEELRDAGAEAISIGDDHGDVVRVVTSSSAQDGKQEIVVDGTHLRAPYVFTAIGDPPTLEKALEIPGGVTDAVAAAGNGAGAAITQHADVQITALRSPRTPRYARPVPASSPAAGPPG
ncbi:MAG TPA: DUF881 domain-containing protein [Mycobacteriales bacterium]|nr:DUF881 domain-containing protein [Mycobacteriales bacterium]